MILRYFFSFLCPVLVFGVIVNCSVHSPLSFNSNDSPGDSKSNSEARYESTTYKYPTATWSAHNYNKKMDSLMSKLYLFKPSPFLKPPFTDGERGSAIHTIEDGINVSGRRRAQIHWMQDDSRLPSANIKADVKFTKESREGREGLLDKFLEEALQNYIKSANLTDEYGTITIEMFAEALSKLTAPRPHAFPAYEASKDVHRKFKDEYLSPKNKGTLSQGGIVERQHQRWLQKTTLYSPNLDIKEDREQTTPTAISRIENAIKQRESNQEAKKYNESMISSFARPTEPTAISRIENAIKQRESNQDANKYNESIISSFARPTEPTKEVTNSSKSVAGVGTEAVTQKPQPVLKHEPKPRKSWRGRKKYIDYQPKTTRGYSDNPEGEVQSVAETNYYRPRLNSLKEASPKTDLEYGAIPGVPDVDYPMLSSAPVTGFKCPKMKRDHSKLVADPKTRCQVFYMCTGDNPPTPMLCPNGTLFNENVMVCDWWFNVNC